MTLEATTPPMTPAVDPTAEVPTTGTTTVTVPALAPVTTTRMTATQATTTGATTDGANWRWRPAFGLRLRLLGWALVLLAVASLSSVLVIRQVLLNQVENRATVDLRQEASEFRRLAAGNNPDTGKPFGTDIAAVAKTYLERNEPQTGEAVLLFVNGVFHGATPDAPADLSQNTELVSHWTSLTESTYGHVEETPAGAARWLAVPVTIDNAVHGHVVITAFGAERRAEVERAVRLMAIACLLVIMVVAAGGYLAMGRALRPLRTVTTTARDIQETDLSRRIAVSGSDEVAALGHTFNGMLARLERAFDTQRSFVSDAGHELRTPITIVRGHLELMGDDPQDRRETVALVTDELDRMNRMVNDLLVLARAEQPDFIDPAVVDAATVIRETFAKASALGDRDWQLGVVEPVTVLADRQRLTQALTQLAQNAVQFTGDGDRIELSVRRSGGHALLAVADTGIGIEPADRRRIFERFARTDAGRSRAEGAGLGLAIVAAIAQAHRGSVAVDSVPGVGSTFTLVLPELTK
jgi:two-component system, OmpR family, sensor kinase